MLPPYCKIPLRSAEAGAAATQERVFLVDEILGAYSPARLERLTAQRTAGASSAQKRFGGIAHFHPSWDANPSDDDGETFSRIPVALGVLGLWALVVACGDIGNLCWSTGVADAPLLCQRARQA